MGDEGTSAMIGGVYGAVKQLTADARAQLAAATDTAVARGTAALAQAGQASAERAAAEIQRAGTSLAAEADRLLAANASPVRMRTRMVTMLAATVLIVLGGIGGYYFGVSIGGEPVTVLEAQQSHLLQEIAHDQDVLSRLARHGANVRWGHCGKRGDRARLCFEAARDQGRASDGSTLPIGSYTDQRGRKMVIPSGY